MNEGFVRALPWAVLLIGLLATFWAWRLARQQSEAAVQQEVSFLLGQTATAIDHRIQQNIQLLRGVVGLFYASDDVSHQEFKTYVRTLELHQHYPGIQGIGVALLLASSERKAHVQRMRRLGFHNYEVYPIAGEGNTGPISYLEPFDWRNQRAFGYDMYSDPVRRAAMDRAWLTGEASLTERVILRQETAVATQYGLLLYLPIFRERMTPSDPEVRDHQILGWAYSPLRVASLMEGLLEQNMPGMGQKLAISIHEGPAADPDRLLFSTRDGHTGPSSSRQDRMQNMFVAGQQWTMVAHPLPGLSKALGKDHETTVLMLGLATSLGLSFLIGLLSKRQWLLSRALAELRLAESVVAHTSEAVMVTDERGQVLALNPGFSGITGHVLEDLKGVLTPALFHPIPSNPRYQDICEQALTGGIWRGEIWMRHKSAKPLLASATVNHIAQDRGGRGHFVWVFHDITTQHLAANRVRHLAFHDPLTSLPNRALFEERLQQSVLRARRENSTLALGFIDLDGFKSINDRLGHDSGDQALKIIAERLRNCARREIDTVARFGGDEFVFLIEGQQAADYSTQLARSIVDAVMQPVLLSGHSITVGASIGIALFPEHAQEAEDLIRRADTAMYAAKAAGKGTYSVYQVARS